MAVGKCRYCGKSLSWRQRSDARYCSNKCRVAAYRALGMDPVEVSRGRARSAWASHPDDQVYLTTWSSPVRCDDCSSFTLRGVKIINDVLVTEWHACFACWPR